MRELTPHRARPGTRRRTRRLAAFPAAAAAAALALAACGGAAGGAGAGGAGAGGAGSTGSAGTTSAGGSLDIASFVPFSGADAAFGPLALSGCYPAVYAINKAGGVLGHHLACTTSDTRGDPVDAVPAANSLVAHDGNVVGVFGPSSDEALATVPILEQAHLPMFLMAGLAQYDHQTSPYVWRLTPADAAEGFAMAAWARKQGYTRAAAVFATGTTSEGDGPAATSGFRKLGGKIVANISLSPGQTSYQTEVSQVVSAHPQVIFFTAPADTSATFFAEMKQLGTIVPTYLTEVAEEPTWVNAVSGAIGAATLSQKFVAFEAQTPASTTSGWQGFHTALMASPQKVPSVGQYSSDPFTLTYYDAANLIALAMLQAHSTKPAVFDSHLLGLTQPGSGKTVVSDFAAGARAIAAGKQIQYVGADGPLLINKFHNVAGDFTGLTVARKPARVGQVPPALMSRAES